LKLKDVGGPPLLSRSGGIELHELHEGELKGRKLPRKGQKDSLKPKDTVGNENKKPKKRHPTEGH